VDSDFRIVRAWGKPFTFLVFQHDYLPQTPRKTIEDIVGGREEIVGDLMSRFPVLLQHQRIGLEETPLPGGRIYEGGEITRFVFAKKESENTRYRSPRMLVVIPVISGDFDFAKDFVTNYSPIFYKSLWFDIKVQRLLDPTSWGAEDGIGWVQGDETVERYP